MKFRWKNWLLRNCTDFWPLKKNSMKKSQDEKAGHPPTQVTHPLCPASFSTKQKIWPTVWFQNKNKAAIWQEWKETGSSNCHTQVYFWTGCVMVLLITVYLMRPSGHVSSHSEKSSRLHCWTRLQEATSSVMCLKVTRTVSMKSRRWFWSLEEAASCCIPLLTRLSAVYSPCRSAWWKHTHALEWSEPKWVTLS